MKRWHVAVAAIAIVLGVIMLLWGTLYGLNAWFERYHLVYHAPIVVRLYAPIRVERRDIARPLPPPTATPEAKLRIIRQVEAATRPPTDQEIAEYIDRKNWDYGVAIRMAKSENYWNLTRSFNCSRTHKNDNGTTDYGLFQINEVHAKRVAKHGWTMDDMLDCYKNTDIAHEIWTEQGWTPWSAYTNGSYLTHDADI